ncbi:MAG: molybdopterin-dependent oxidoreductase, partial [Candidatus Omnitrophica bacterium]|nr:molybdopterin-dependent oxidoreductase [Candidatus Omnitrophota bacterium]
DNRERAQRPHVAGGKRVMRLKPRYNPDVNRWWMCDEGRYGYHAIDDARLTQVQVRDGAALRQGSWDEALGRVTDTIKRLSEAKQLDRFGVILSTQLTNEELYVAKQLFASLRIHQVAVQGPPRPGTSDDLLMQADTSPNTRGAHALGLPFDSAKLLERAARKELSVLYVFGHDLVDVYGQQAATALAKNVELLIFQGSNTNACEVAHVILPSAVYAEKDGTFTNYQGRVQRIHPAFPPLGEAKADWQILAELAKRVNAPCAFPDAQTIFKELAAREAAFASLSYDLIGDQGALLNNNGKVAK